MIPNNYMEFEETFQREYPPNDWPEGLKALWFDAKGNWNSSHDLAQEMLNDLGSWIHGYLHRKEGDEWNAGYWYRMANKPFPKNSLKEELKEIVEYVLASKVS
ncbi:hypothetical protein [Maribacter sp. HTCC2170]|uniref:hypothetical protein n=1 Tax=Maribacter sp. (strain HTCC2170 / KCCM 42371) TaxID=313603 RepID=UPI00006B21E1|nr:hypothetical protein [Maribacter sp. HTCC2170]EAR00422.1 hypothetical protein FB2170_13411 [Maribacter sp. HTCC2170]